MAANDEAALSVADLPLILALSREKTLAGAAERLDVDLSTVFRRLNTLEKRLRVRLFDRSPRGYQLTAAGERAAAGAERVETELLALDRDISGRDQQLSGVLRVTASETLSHAVLPRLFAQFHAVHPRIQLVLVHRQPRARSRPPRGGRGAARAPSHRSRLCLAAVSPASPGRFTADCSTAQPAPRGRRVQFLTRHSVIGWEEPARIVAGDWIAANVPSDRIFYRSNSLVNQLMAVRAGLGIALLPCYLADADDGLRRISGVLRGARERVVDRHAPGPQEHRAHPRIPRVIGDAIVAARRSFEGLT